MAKGDGSIIEKGRGRWEVQIPLGRDPITGRYRKKSRVVHGTKADARRVRDEMRREIEQGIKVDADKMTFSDFSKIFIAQKKSIGVAAQATIDQNEKRLKFICSFIGDMPLKKIDVCTIELLYPEIKKRRIEQGYKCGNTTLHGYHVLLKTVLKKAVDYGYILRNPCDKVTAPQLDEVHRRSLTLEEAGRLLKTLDEAEEVAIQSLLNKEERQSFWGVAEDRSYLLGMRDVGYILAVRIGLATGMRLGEVLALTWGAVDFNTLSLTIKQALDSKSKPKAPKSRAGFRTIATDEDVMTHLAKWYHLQTELLDSLCIDVCGDSPVLCSATGDYLNKNNFETWWRSWRSKNGFEGLKFHELRHTQATQLLANDVDMKTVQNRLGHSSASLTLDLYAHAVPENDQEAAQMLGDLFRKSGKPKQTRMIAFPKTA